MSARTTPSPTDQAIALLVGVRAGIEASLAQAEAQIVQLDAVILALGGAAAVAGKPKCPRCGSERLLDAGTLGCEGERPMVCDVCTHEFTLPAEPRAEEEAL